MKPYLSALIVSLLFIPAFSWAETTHHHAPLPDADAVEHVELVLPGNLLPGLPLTDQALGLNEAVELGLANSLGIQVARADVGVQQAMLRMVRAERWPVISVGSLTFVKTRNNQTLMTPDMMMTTAGEYFFQDLNATARVPLFTGGRITSGIRAARFALDGTQAAQQQTIVETAYRIKEAYLTALYSQQEHLVHQEHISVQRQLLRNAEIRYQVGRGLRADVLRIQTEIADARRMLNEEHIRLNNALFDLMVEMGFDLASNIQLAEQLALTPWQGPSLDTLLRHASLNHPRMIEAQRAVEEAQAQIRVARSQYLPEVYGQVTGNLRFPDEPPMMGNGVIGMVSASLPVFSRERGADIARAQAVALRAEQSRRAVQLEIAKGLAQAWNELTFARENARLADAAVSQAEEDLRLMQQRYSVGRAVIVEVQDAAQQLRQVQLNRVEAIFNHELAKARLLRELGVVREGDALTLRIMP